MSMDCKIPCWCPITSWSKIYLESQGNGVPKTILTKNEAGRLPVKRNQGSDDWQGTDTQTRDWKCKAQQQSQCLSPPLTDAAGRAVGEGPTCPQSLFLPLATPSKHGPSPTSHCYQNSLEVGHDLNVKWKTKPSRRKRASPWDGQSFRYGVRSMIGKNDKLDFIVIKNLCEGPC